MAAAASVAEGQYSVVVASGKAEELAVGVVGPSTVSWSFSLPQHNIVFRAEFRPPGLQTWRKQVSGSVCMPGGRAHLLPLCMRTPSTVYIVR